MVTRTEDNKQLGLSVLIDSLKPGETKYFVEYSHYNQAVYERDKSISDHLKIIDKLRNENEQLRMRLKGFSGS